jgi:hypothetical protein
MLEQKHTFGAPTGTLVLHALTRSRLELDGGRYTYAALQKPPLVRNGQGIAVYAASETLTGRRGTLVVRRRSGRHRRARSAART